MFARMTFSCVVAMLVAFGGVVAHGESGEQPGAAKAASAIAEAGSGAAENLTVTVELPSTSSHVRSLPQQTGEVASAGEVVRLTVPVASEALADLPVAEVGEETITLAELWRVVRPAEDAEGGDRVAATTLEDPVTVLDRLVTTRLIAGEARAIGLDELPEVRNLLDVFARRTLRETLLRRHIREVDADPAEVEKLYREAVQEWRVKALIFKEEQVAERFRKDVLAGASFGEAGGKYVAEGKAASQGGDEGRFLKRKEVSPGIAEKIGGLEVGSVTPVIPVDNSFAVVKLEETRFPDDEEAKAKARERARNFAQNTALVKYNRELTDKHVTLHKEFFEELEFGGSVDGFLKLMEDDRIVAEVVGDEPLRVFDLARGIREKFYHGIGKAIESGEINRRKVPVLNEILFKRVFLREALAQGIDNTPHFRAAVQDYENSVLFGAFIEKVLKPEIKITADDLRSYYEESIEKYTFPEMVKLRSLVFTNAEDARRALEKLRKGTDFGWVKANSGGQVEAGADGPTRFPDGPVTVESLPEAVRSALAGADEGDFMLHKEGERRVHVLNLEKRTPSRAQPLEEVQRNVLQDLYGKRIDEGLRDWTEKLREAYGVEVYAKEFGGTTLHESP